MDLSNSFSVFSISPPPSPPRSHQQPSNDPNPNPNPNSNPNPLKPKALEEDLSKTANGVLESSLSSPRLHHQQQKASGNSNPSLTHRHSRKSKKPRRPKCSNPLSSPHFQQQQQQTLVNVPASDEIQKAFQAAKTADEMLEVFLQMASLMREGNDPKKILSFAGNAISTFDRDANPTLPLAMALQLKGSATYSLNRFEESLESLNRANEVLGRLEEDGLHMNCIRPLLHKVHCELARVNMAMGRMEDGFQSLRKCLKITEMSLDEPGKVGDANYELADAYVGVLNYKDALPFCLRALALHVSQLGHDSEKVMQDRLLLTRIYSGLFEYEKALEQNELLRKVLKDSDLGFELLCREIDAADLVICLRKYDEALVILKRALQKSDKESETRAHILILMANVLFERENSVDLKRCLQAASGILENGKMKKTIKVGEAYEKMGMLYETMKEYDLAISFYKRMLSILEKHPQEQKSAAALSRARLGKTLLLVGKVPQGISYLESAIGKMKESIGPNHIELVNVYKYLWAAYLMSRKSKLATQMFTAMEAIPEVDSSTIETCEALSEAYDIMESSEFAVEKQKRVIRQFKRRGRNAEVEFIEANRLLDQALKRAHVESVAFAEQILDFLFH